MTEQTRGGKPQAAVKSFPLPLASELPLALTALVLIYPVLTYPLIHFGVHGKTRTFILWADAGAKDLVWIALLVWCAVGATVLTSVCLTGRELYPHQRKGTHLVLPKVIRFASIWEAPIVLVLAVAVGLLSLADLGAAQLGAGCYLLLGLSLVIVITRRLRTGESAQEIRGKEAFLNLKEATHQNLSVVWALIVTSLLLYLPAMLCPIATFTLYGGSETRTILGGVASLFEEDKPLLAMIVFIASVAIPLLKLAGLGSLLLIVRYRWKSRQQTRVRIYRIYDRNLLFSGAAAEVGVFQPDSRRNALLSQAPEASHGG